MEKYLSEERYKNTKKKLVKIANIVVVIGVILTLVLLVTGFIKKSNSVKTTDIDNQINTLRQEISILEEQRTNEFMQNSFSSKFYELSRQIDTKQDQLNKLKSDQFFDSESYIGYFIGAPFVVMLFGIVAGCLYFIAYRRNITAFSVQQTMPVVKEGVEEITPTLGKMVGEMSKQVRPIVKEELEDIAPSIGKVAEEISKGISKGKSQNQDNK